LPDSTRAHLLQKETDHFYTAVTKVHLPATDPASKAGLYLTNGDQQVNVRLYSGYENGKKIIFKLDTAVRSITNSFGNTVWLKVERNEHQLTAYCSGDGMKWVAVGTPISAVNLDKVQPNYNSWVGTSVGLFAEGQPADFDLFVCKDGFSSLPAIGYNNYFGVEKVKQASETAVTTTTANGGWFMLSGVELGNDKRTATQVEILASSKNGGKLELWLDDLTTGKLIATVEVRATGGENSWKPFTKALKDVSGHHDIFIKYPPGQQRNTFIKSIRFLSTKYI
jgi:xylan 1,4-beta-xylosidase